MKGDMERLVQGDLKSLKDDLLHLHATLSEVKKANTLKAEAAVFVPYGVTLATGPCGVLEGSADASACSPFFPMRVVAPRYRGKVAAEPLPCSQLYRDAPEFIPEPLPRAHDLRHAVAAQEALISSQNDTIASLMHRLGSLQGQIDAMV